MPALALAPDTKRWLVGKRDFLVHVKPLAQLFRAKFRAGLRQTQLTSQVKVRVWSKPWVVDCRPVGSGASALKYLAPYIFRIALSNNRIERVAKGKVTFRYTDGKTGERKRETLSAETFISRFLAHVLPKGLVKVRYYGLLHPSKRALLVQARSVVALGQGDVAEAVTRVEGTRPEEKPDVMCCAKCGQMMQLVKRLEPQRGREELPKPVPQASSRGPPFVTSAWLLPADQVS